MIPVKAENNVQAVDKTLACPVFHPLPPLSEQKQIVLVMDGLLDLCCELSYRLERTLDTGERLFRAPLKDWG